MAAARSPCRCFKTRVLHFRLKNTPLKDKKMERESSKECSAIFLWRKGEAFHQEIVLRGFNLVFFMTDRDVPFIIHPPPHERLFWSIFHLTSRNLRLFPSIPVGIYQLITLSAYQRFLLVGTCSSFDQSP